MFVLIWGGEGGVSHPPISSFKKTNPYITRPPRPLRRRSFNFGDELVWNCLPPADLETAANAVRADFPRGSAILWYNEAGGPLAHPPRNGAGCTNKPVQRNIRVPLSAARTLNATLVTTGSRSRCGKRT